MHSFGIGEQDKLWKYIENIIYVFGPLYISKYALHVAIRKEKLWPKMTKPLCGLYYNKQVWFVRILMKNKYCLSVHTAIGWHRLPDRICFGNMYISIIYKNLHIQSY